MSDSSHHKKRSYSSAYVIYRRMRYIRHRKKTIKRIKKEQIEKELQEKQQTELKVKEFHRSEKEQLKLKIKAQKVEEKRIREEIKAELEQRKILASQEKSREEAVAVEKKRLEQKEELKEQARKKQEDRTMRRAAREARSQARKQITFKSRLSSFKEKAPARRRYLLIIFNSTVFFLLSYFVLFFISQITTVIAASFFNYPVIVYYYEIYFNISPEAWYHDSVKTIFSSGPLIVFVIGIISLIVYHNIKESVISYKLFFLWGFLHGVNMLFGALLVGTLFETGVGHVISWMYIMDTGKVLYSIISIFLLVIAGLLATKPFLISANTYYNEINRTNRNAFIFAQVLIPYFAGNAFLIILRQPHFIFYDTFIAMALLVSIIPVLATYSTYNELYFEEEDKKPVIPWIGIGALVLAILIFRVVQAIGIRF